jgi:hypothetical protein
MKKNNLFIIIFAILLTPLAACISIAFLLCFIPYIFVAAVFKKDTPESESTNMEVDIEDIFTFGKGVMNAMQGAKAKTANTEDAAFEVLENDEQSDNNYNTSIL